MTFKSTLTKNLILAVLVAFAGNISAQTFWSVDFEGGLPTDWISEDLSTNGAVWTWCGDPLGGTGDCSPIFDDQTNGQSPFQATSADNGFMTVNSDAFNAPVSNPHISQLTTTAIDCSAETAVYIKFESHIGVYDLDATGNALLRVSTNGTDYVDYDCFEGLTTGVRWSDNPEEVIFDLTDIAAGQATVYLQWQWTGAWEYFWNLDDIILTSENPTSPNDIQVNDNFFAIAPNAQTPISQIEAFGFLADVENVGLFDQPNVNLTITIEADAAPGTDIYTETLGYGTVMMDSIVENVLFPGIGFTPPSEIASYTGEYNITSDSMDADLSNNTLTFDFEITENVFAKDRGITRTITPAASNWDDGESWSWAYGNFYHVVNGTGWWANEAVFGIGNATPDIAGQTVFVTLYQWEDTNVDGNADPDERTPVGSNTYAILGTEGTTEADLITLPILDNNTLEPGVSLMDNTDYILMLEYSAVDQTQISFLASGDYDSGAQTLRTQELGVARYGSMLGVNDPLSSEPFSSAGFGTDIAPIARMTITDELMSSVATLSVDNKVNVFPSPASNYIDVALELTDVQREITIRVMDVSGKTIGQRQVNDVQNETYRFDVSTLPVGSYFLNLITPSGNRNVPFVVQR